MPSKGKTPSVSKGKTPSGPKSKTLGKTSTGKDAAAPKGRAASGPKGKSAGDAVNTTCVRLEKLLEKSPAYRKVDRGLYVIKQGSCLVMISVHPWKETHVILRLTAQLVKGVTMEVPLALKLLELNASLRFGAFAWVPASAVIVFSHTLVERALADGQEFLDTIRDFAIVADEYDDRIAARYGGQTMEELMEENAIHHLREAYAKDDPLK